MPKRGEAIPAVSNQPAPSAGAAGANGGTKQPGAAGVASPLNVPVGYGSMSSPPRPTAAGHPAAAGAGAPLAVARAPTFSRGADLPPARNFADYVRRDPLKGVGIGVAAGMAMRVLLPFAARLALRRAPRRI
jgi:hypothetical protein